MNSPQDPPNRWTVDYLASLSDEALERLADRTMGNLTVSKLILGRCLLALERTGLPARRGLSGAIHYAVLKGVELIEAREARRVAGRCEGLPLLREAAETGRIGWTYLREVVRVASPETEATWLELCQRHSSRRIQRLVRNTREGADPLAESGEVSETEPLETELRLTIPIELSALLARASRDLSTRAQRPLSLRAVLECLVAQHLAGSPFPDESARQKLAEQARRDLAAERAAERREVEELRGEEQLARVFEAPWAAVAAAEEPCPGEPELQLVKPAHPHWENPNLQFNPQARHLTSAQHAEIVRRDAYACSTPDCPHQLWLQVHHIVFYCQGGVTVPLNLTTICAGCHRNIHEGRLRLARRDDGRLLWTDAEGRELSAQPPRGWFQEAFLTGLGEAGGGPPGDSLAQERGGL